MFPAASSYTDSTLDSMYEQAFNGNLPSLSEIRSEIVSRLASPLGFVSGIFGHDRFPKFQTLTPSMYSQTAMAQTSLKDSASNLAGSTIPVVLVAAVVFVLVMKK